MSPLQVGDFLLRPKALGFTHVGVWMGCGAVFHNSPGRGERIATLVDFSQGAPVTAQRSNADPAAVVARVEAKLAAPGSYDTVANNCEHSANAVVAGVPGSAQLRVVVSLLVVVVTAVAIARKR